MKKSTFASALLALMASVNAVAALPRALPTNVNNSCNSTQWQAVLVADLYAEVFSRAALNRYLNNPATGKTYFGQSTLSETVIGQLLKLHGVGYWSNARKYLCQPFGIGYYPTIGSNKTVLIGTEFFSLPLYASQSDYFQIKYLVQQWMQTSIGWKSPGLPEILISATVKEFAGYQTTGHNMAVSIAASPEFAWLSQLNTDNYALYVTDPYAVSR